VDRVKQLAALQRIRALKRVRGAADVSRARRETDEAQAHLAAATESLAAAKEASASRRSAILTSAAVGLPGRTVVGRLEDQVQFDATVAGKEEAVGDAQYELERAQRRTAQAERVLGELHRREQAVDSAHRRSFEQQVLESEGRAEMLSEEERVSPLTGASG
jgi:hypothetical protein